MSNWSCVTQLLENHESITLGRYVSYWIRHTPRRLLHCMSYYKFAAKMIGPNKRVLDIGCNEGLGTWVMGKECGYCKGIDFDEEAFQKARHNFKNSCVEFSCEDFLESAPGIFDAAVCFDVIEHIYPEHALDFFKKIAENLHDNGTAVIGTPSLISQEFASAISKKGHVNIYSHERLEKELREHFEYVFLFSANDEVVHTGFLPLAHYFIALVCKPKR